MCGPHLEAGQQGGVFGDYRTVAGRVRGKALSAPSASLASRNGMLTALLELSEPLLDVGLCLARTELRGGGAGPYVEFFGRLVLYEHWS